MNSSANHEARLDDEPHSVRNPMRRTAAVVLFIGATGCFAVAGIGDCRAEDSSPVTAAEASQISVAATAPATPAPPSVTDIRAVVVLPSNASAELRAVVRDAIAGRPLAEHDLGTFFALGVEVPQDLERAAYWYRRAADQGVANAAYNLGVLLERGLGVQRDPEAAVARFREAAEAGHAGALNALGLAYRNGSGVPRDPLQALIWFQRASAGGDPRGAYNVAKLYESGELGTPDQQTAVGWYRVAAEAGDKQARAALARLQASTGADVPLVFRTGFVSLTPEAGFLALDRTGASIAGPDPILDGLAARMAGSASSDPIDARGGNLHRSR